MGHYNGITSGRRYRDNAPAIAEAAGLIQAAA